MLRPTTIDRVREAAHARGLLVVAHANALDTQRIAVDAHVDVLAHGLWRWTGVSDSGAIPTEIAEHLRKVHQQGIGWQPTLRVMAGLGELFVDGSIDDPLLKRITPPELLVWYRTDAAQTFKREMKKDAGQIPDAVIARQMEVLDDRGMRATKYLFDLGHPLLLATDTPSSPAYVSQPGYETYREMQLLARSGVALKAILEAATLNNVKQFRLDKDYGTVQVGKIANLLLLDANPLDSIDAWNDIDKVILHGTRLDRESLAVENRQ
jgi:imidazolonepropionase-like amidohydrolase